MLDMAGRPGRRLQLIFSDEDGEDGTQASQFQDADYTQQPRVDGATAGREQKVIVRYMSPEWEIDGEDQTDVPWLKESRSTCERLSTKNVPYWAGLAAKKESDEQEDGEGE